MTNVDPIEQISYGEFEEQPVEQLYSTLMPEDEQPDPVDEMFGAFGDIGRTGLDVAAHAFRPRWPWDTWSYTDRWPGMFRAVGDLVTKEHPYGGDLPELEWLDKEKQLEAQYAQQAEGMLPVGDRPVDRAASDTALKALHFETMTGESAFMKFINWLGKNSIEVAARSGTPLGESLIYEEGPREGGPMQLREQFAGQGRRPTARVVDLRGQEGANELRMYLEANWGDIEELQKLVEQKLAANWSEFMTAYRMADTGEGVTPISRGGVARFGDNPETDPELFQEIMRQFGGFGDNTATLATLDDVYGGGSAVDIVGGVVSEAIAEFQTELTRRQNTMLIGPDILTAAEYGEGEGEEGVLINQIGFITSFDGTPYGDITSVNDLFSGGKIGPLDALPYMESLWFNTRDSQGYSAIIERIQQELFAWGMLDPTEGPTFEWGKLDIPGEQGRADRTVDALQMFQADIINEALDAWEDPSRELAPDGTVYMDTIVQRLIGRNVNRADASKAGMRQQEQRIIQEVSRRIAERVNQNPSRTITQQGIKEVQATLEEMIDEMGSESRERYFGRGGGVQERQIVNSLMADFYQDANWGSQIFFGGSNNDQDFMNWASGVGALTDEQVDLLDRGQMAPENFRSTWSPNDLKGLQAAEEDVVTSNLLKMISNNMTGEAMDANAIRQGLMTFAHTIGQRTSAEYGYSNQDLIRMVDKAMATAEDDPAESPLVSTFEDRLAESYNLVGGGGGPDFRSLMESLERRRQPGTNVLRVRNV